MMTTRIVGMYDLDKEVKVFSENNSTAEVSTYSLRGALYTVKLSDGRILFAEMYQARAMAHMDIVIIKTKEAVQMVEMMNKNTAAYLSNYLVKAGLSLALVRRLLEIPVVDPTMVLDIGNCKWEAKTKTLTTPSDAANEARLVLKQVAWYNNDFGMKLAKRW